MFLAFISLFCFQETGTDFNQKPKGNLFFNLVLEHDCCNMKVMANNNQIKYNFISNIQLTMLVQLYDCSSAHIQ